MRTTWLGDVLPVEGASKVHVCNKCEGLWIENRGDAANEIKKKVRSSYYAEKR